MPSTAMAPKPSASANASARGRTAVSKPLNSTTSTASTRAKQAAATLPAQKKPQGTLGVTPSQKVSQGPSVPIKSSRTPSNTETPTNDAKPRVNITRSNPPSAKPAVVPSVSTTSKPKLPPQLPTAAVSVTSTIEEHVPRHTSDPLQVAAQLYPWLYMTSTLEACFQTAEQTAKKDLEAREKQLEEEESDISDQRIRFDAERAADFYDELSTDLFATEAPLIMQAFLSHGEACTRLEAEALQLATQGASEPDEDSPLRVYVEMLDSLEILHAEAVELELSILKISSEGSNEQDPSENGASTARSQILGVFSACLPVLRARISNLLMAQELIDGAQENLSISLRMESLGLSD